MHLRALAPFIAQLLTDLCNLSLRTASILDDWCNTTVCRLFNKGDREGASNYRPVNHQSFLKIMKSILKTPMINHLILTAAISDAQHGFVPRRSCLTSLLLNEKWVTALKGDGNTCDTVFLDFAKEFDSVNHRILCLKQRAYGINSTVIYWVQAFLSTPTQRR